MTAPALVTVLVVWRTYVYFSRGFGWRREGSYGVLASVVAGFAMLAAAFIARDADFHLWHRVLALASLLFATIFVANFPGPCA